jgi:hypothetical protein
MTLLELVSPQPNWMDALGVALTRPPGVPERRAGEDPMAPPPSGRPRRISDDLAWLRQAIDEPADHGLRELTGTAAVAAWESPEDGDVHERLQRLAERHVLDAAGFLLHAPEDAALA